MTQETTEMWGIVFVTIVVLLAITTTGIGGFAGPSNQEICSDGSADC